MSLSSWKDVLGGEGGGFVNEDSEKLEIKYAELSKLELPNIASFDSKGKNPRFPTAPVVSNIYYAVGLSLLRHKGVVENEATHLFRSRITSVPMPPRKGCVDGGLVCGDALL